MSVTPEPSPLSRRSFSLPISRNSPTPDPQIEELFTLNSARIVAFSTPNAPSRPGSGGDYPSKNEEAGLLSWTTRFETTIAVGSLRIYRAPGSVAFLNCATALRPILPKSQVWCVDGDSKFVLQIRRPQYWRIEVSNETEEDKTKVEELKQVLGDLLLFEKTPCPFQRDFIVELPEAPVTPVTKRPWKPVQGPRPQTPLSPDTSVDYGYATSPLSRRASSASPLRQSLLSNGRRKSELDLGATAVSDGSQSPQRKTITPPNEPTTTILETEEPKTVHQFVSQLEGQQQPLLTLNNSPSVKGYSEVLEEGELLPRELSREPVLQDEDDNLSEATDDTGATPRPRGRLNSPIHFSEISAPKKSVESSTQLDKQHPMTEINPEPPVLSIITDTSLKQNDTTPIRSEESEDEGFSSSVESFHTVQSWHSLSPTDSQPSSPVEGIAMPEHGLSVSKRPHHLREVSELTITTQGPHVWEMASTSALDLSRGNSSPEPTTPTLVPDGSEKSEDERFEILTPPAAKQGLRHRATTSSNSRRRQLSPLPAAANLFSPTRSRPQQLRSRRHLPTAIIQKTCEILLSPPSHLFNLMLNIASKIVAGEWRGVFLSHEAPVHWDFEDQYAGELGEDDYGIDLGHSAKTNKTPSNSWEVD